MSQQGRSHPGTRGAKPAPALHPESLRPRLFVPGAENSPEFLPFRHLNDPHLRALDIQWRSPAGDVIDHWELVLQRDRYAADALSEWEPEWTNPRIRTRLLAAARADRSDSPHEGGSSDRIGLSESGEPATVAPSILWLGEGRFVSPRCPNSLELLVTCTDDEALAAAGLPAYSRSAVRFLVSPASLADDRPRFYSADPFPENERVFTVVQLLADQIVVREKARDAGLPDVLADWTATNGSGPTVKDLRVLTLHESVAVARRSTGIDLLTAANRIGRGDFDDEFGRAGRLFGADGSGLDALEVLRLKVALNLRALEEIHGRYRAGLGPHLGLGPDAFSVGFPGGDEYAGALWNVRARLVGLPAAARVPDTPDPGAYRLLARPSGAFSPAVFTDGRYDATRHGTLEVASVETAGDRAKATLILRDPDASHPPVSARDWIRVKTPADARPFALDAWAPIAKDRDVPPGALGLTLFLPPDRGEILARWDGPIATGYLLAPCLHAPADLYAMGMMLVASLVGAQDLSVAAIDEALADWRAQAGREPGGGEEVSHRLVEKAARWLDSSRFAESFGRHRVFADPEDRREGRPNAIPGWIWRDVLVLGLRMTTYAPGFGFCRDHGDFDPGDAARTFEPALAELRVILERIDSVLLSGSLRNREVRHVIRRMRAEGSGAPKTGTT